MDVTAYGGCIVARPSNTDTIEGSCSSAAALKRFCVRNSVRCAASLNAGGCSDSSSECSDSSGCVASVVAAFEGDISVTVEMECENSRKTWLPLTDCKTTVQVSGSTPCTNPSIVSAVKRVSIFTCLSLKCRRSSHLNRAFILFAATLFAATLCPDRGSEGLYQIPSDTVQGASYISQVPKHEMHQESRDRNSVGQFAQIECA